LIDIRDDWEEAWELAGEFRDTAIELGLATMFTVQEVRVPRLRHERKTYGIYLVNEAALRRKRARRDLAMTHPGPPELIPGDVCEYTTVHIVAGVPATQVITTPVGRVRVCDACAALYERLQGGPEDLQTAPWPAPPSGRGVQDRRPAPPSGLAMAPGPQAPAAAGGFNVPDPWGSVTIQDIELRTYGGRLMKFSVRAVNVERAMTIEADVVDTSVSYGGDCVMGHAHFYNYTGAELADGVRPRELVGYVRNPEFIREVKAGSR
jgi:hypothetical protein